MSEKGLTSPVDDKEANLKVESNLKEETVSYKSYVKLPSCEMIGATKITKGKVWSAFSIIGGMIKFAVLFTILVMAVLIYVQLTKNSIIIRRSGTLSLTQFDNGTSVLLDEGSTSKLGIINVSPSSETKKRLLQQNEDHPTLGFCSNIYTADKKHFIKCGNETSYIEVKSDNFTSKDKSYLDSQYQEKGSDPKDDDGITNDMGNFEKQSTNPSTSNDNARLLKVEYDEKLPNGLTRHVVEEMYYTIVSRVACGNTISIQTYPYTNPLCRTVDVIVILWKLSIYTCNGVLPWTTCNKCTNARCECGLGNLFCADPYIYCDFTRSMFNYKPNQCLCVPPKLCLP